MHHSLRAFLITTLALGVTAISLNIAVDNPYFHKVFGNAINEKVEEVSNAKLDFKAISLQFLPPGIDIYGISVKDLNGNEILSSSRLQARLSIVSLFLGKPKLSLVKASELRTSYPFPSDLFKESNDDSKEKSGQKTAVITWPPNFELPVNEFSITDATVDILIPSKKDKKNSHSARLDGLDLNLEFEGWDEWLLAIDLNRLNFLKGERHLIKDAKLNLELQNSNNSIKSKALQVSSQRMDISGKSQITLETKKQKIDLFGGRRLVNYDLLGIAIDGEFRVNSADTSLLGDFLGTSDSDGLITGEAQFKSSFPFDDRKSSWGLDAKIQSLGARLSGFKLLESSAQLSINHEKISFKNVEVRDDKNVNPPIAKASGELYFNNKVDYKFDIVPNRTSFTKLLNVVKVEGYSALEAKISSRNLSLVGQGSPFNMRISGDAFFEQLTMSVHKAGYRYPSPDCRFKLDFQIDSEKLFLDKNHGLCNRDDLTPPRINGPLNKDQVQAGLSPLTLHGPIYFSSEKGMNLQFSSKSIEGSIFEHFIENPLSGNLNLNGAIVGPYDKLNIVTNATGEDVAFLGFPSKSLSLDAKYKVNEGYLDVKSAIFKESEDQYLHLKDTKLFVDNLVLKGHIDGKNLSENFIREGVKTLFPSSNFEFGIKKINGPFEFPILKPLSWKGNLDLSIKNFKLENETYLTLYKGRVVATEKEVLSNNSYFRLDLLEVNLSYKEQRIKKDLQTNDKWASLGLNLDNPIKIEFNTNAIENSSYIPHKKFDPLSHIASIPIVGKIFSKLETGGNIQLHSKLEGTFRHLEGSFNGNFYRAVALGSPIAPIQFSGFAKGSKIDIPILKHAGNSLVGRLSFDFLKEGIPYKWYFYLDQFDSRALLSPFFSKDPRNYSYVTADWSMEGKFQNWWNSSGYLNINKIESQFVQKADNELQKIEVISEKPINLTFSPDSWNFKNDKSLTLNSKEFSINIGLNDNNPPHKLDLTTKGFIDLSILKKLSPAIETSKGKVLFQWV